MVDGEESSELWTAASRQKGLQESGCETSYPDVIFHSSSILDPATHVGLLLLGTCDVHPSSFLSSFSGPFIRPSLAAAGKAHGKQRQCRKGLWAMSCLAAYASPLVLHRLVHVFNVSETGLDAMRWPPHPSEPWEDATA